MKRALIIVAVVLFASYLTAEWQDQQATPPTTTVTTVDPWTCREATKALDLHQGNAARRWLRMCRDDLERAGQDTSTVDGIITVLG